MDFDFWNNCWGRPTQPFHLTTPHHFLTQYFTEFFAQEKKVLLPLCGKTQDLNFLAQHGVTAVGVEFNPLAVESFFKESHLSPSITELDYTDLGQQKLYKAHNIELWLADFFKLGTENLGRFKVIFDRASLVALPENLRADYAKHLTRFMAKHARLLVVTMDYDADEMSGPPFYVSKQELVALFPRATITELDRFSILETHPRWQELELSRLDEVLYDIQINN
jgi:thiopurine S-methyltransferase